MKHFLACDECKVPMITRTATRQEPYAYELGGLSDFHLVGIDVHRCPTCHFETPSIPHLSGLHRLITRKLIRKPSTLTGGEVRFLRKRAGLSQEVFARAMRMQQESVSRIESGHRAIGDTADLWLRTIVAAHELRPDHVAGFIQRLADGRTYGPFALPHVYQLLGQRWSVAA